MACQALPSRIGADAAAGQTHRAALQKIFLAKKHHALFLGRGDHHPIALEGALKRKISGIHAKPGAAGEPEHGPLALIDADMPVIVAAPNNELLEKLRNPTSKKFAPFAAVSCTSSPITRMRVSSVATTCINIEMPHVEEVIALYLSHRSAATAGAYHVALIKGTDVDQPRNPGEISDGRVSQMGTSRKGRRQTACVL